MMRTRWLGVGLALLLGSAARAQAPAGQYSATVIVAEAEVRCGAGNTPQMYVTSKLHKGDRVEVLREVNGDWLAIKPPVGSFSWVNARLVKQIVPNQPMYVVVAPSVPVLVGSIIKSDRPTVEGVRVERGQQLKSVGPLRLADDGYWLPVEPHADEMRYIQAPFVSRKPAETIAGARPSIPVTPDAPPVATPPGQFAPPPAVAADGAGAGSPASAQAGVNPLWAQAQQEEYAGHYSAAIQLYDQLAAAAANSNSSLSTQAYTRADYLRKHLPQQPPARSDAARAATAAQIPAGYARSGVGFLRSGGRSVNLNPLFRLEDSRGQPLMYAVAQPGYTLTPYEGKMVDLIGVRQWRDDLHAYQMTVTQVDMLGK